MSQHTVLSEILLVMISGWQCSYLIAKAGLPGLIFIAIILPATPITMHYSIQTKTGTEVYLKARSRRITNPVVDSVSQTYHFAPFQYSFRIKNLLNCKL